MRFVLAFLCAFLPVAAFGQSLPSPQVRDIKLSGKLTAKIPSLITTQTTPNGSVGEGSEFHEVTRTGGFGQYGNALDSYDITAATPDGQFDVGRTTWVNHRNLTGGQLFAGWWGANTPSSGNDYSGNPLNQTFTAGAAVGGEVNVGNRWADFGLQMYPGTRKTVGLQIVPDVLPAKDGPTTAIYPGTYAVTIGPSIHGHKWWVGEYISQDGIMPGGIAYLLTGGSTLPNAPKAGLYLQGFWQAGIDFSGAAYADAVMKFSSGQVSGNATAGGGVVTPATVAGFINIKVDGVVRKIPYFSN